MFRSVILALFLLQAPFEPGTISKNPVVINDDMRQLLDRHVESGATEMERLETLVYVVFNRQTLGFEYQNETRSAIETFQNRGGNCLSFTNMFVGMARYLNLDVAFREVEVPPSWGMRGRLIVLSHHINVSVKIGGRSFIVDLFPEINTTEIGGRTIPDERAFAHFFNNRAAEALAKGKRGLALEYCIKALQWDDSVPFVWTNMGVIFSHLGQMERAENSYRKAIRLDQEYLAAISNLGNLLQREGRLDEANRYMERAEEFRNRNPYFHYSLGEQALESGDYLGSIRHFEEALKRKKKEHNFHFALARAYAGLGDLNQVQKNLEKALEYAPDERGRSRYSQKLDILYAGRVQHH